MAKALAEGDGIPSKARCCCIQGLAAQEEEEADEEVTVVVVIEVVVAAAAVLLPVVVLVPASVSSVPARHYFVRFVLSYQKRLHFNHLCLA